jgi:hypothetical protein
MVFQLSCCFLTVLSAHRHAPIVAGAALVRRSRLAIVTSRAAAWANDAGLSEKKAWGWWLFCALTRNPAAQ